MAEAGNLKERETGVKSELSSVSYLPAAVGDRLSLVVLSRNNINHNSAAAKPPENNQWLTFRYRLHWIYRQPKTCKRTFKTAAKQSVLESNLNPVLCFTRSTVAETPDTAVLHALHTHIIFPLSVIIKYQH